MCERERSAFVGWEIGRACLLPNTYCDDVTAVLGGLEGGGLLGRWVAAEGARPDDSEGDIGAHLTGTKGKGVNSHDNLLVWVGGDGVERGGSLVLGCFCFEV